jgi:membrane-associated phospholipid phosphatase
VTVTSDLDAAAPATPAVSAAPKYGWVRETAIVVGFYYVYQTIRSLADHGGVTNRAYANARRLVDWEQQLGIFHEQAIQQAFLAAHWFIRVMNIYYGTLHFIITVGLLVWLYRKRHHAYRPMRNLLGLTTTLALVGYWAFPLAPPRLYKCNDNIPVPGPDGFTIGKCFVDTLSKVGGLWSYHSPVAKAVANQYAAMPSLHFAWSVWCAIVLWRYSRHTSMRVVGLLYPLLTLFAIVVTANHYFLDALGGAIAIAAAAWIIRAHERRRSRRLAANAAQVAMAPAS